MLKLNTISIAMDASHAEKAHKLIDSLLNKTKAYNKEVEKSNKLLREQENLRRKLNVRVEKGKVTGLVEYQPTEGSLDSKNTPKEGSGVPNKRK